MHTRYSLAFAVVWLLFWGYWMLASRGTAASARAESFTSRLSYSALLVLGAALLGIDRLEVGPLGWQVLPEGPATFGIGLVLLVLGLAFAVWARIQLGRFWSGTVTIKVGHELIQRGPYQVVRHPIYSGILLGLLGTVLALGELRGFIALTLFVLAFEIKLRREERWLTQQFGVAYQAYQRQVKALVPLVW